MGPKRTLKGTRRYDTEKKAEAELGVTLQQAKQKLEPPSAR
jgi:hypothetical protein